MKSDVSTEAEQGTYSVSHSSLDKSRPHSSAQPLQSNIEMRTECINRLDRACCCSQFESETFPLSTTFGFVACSSGIS
jgi:hypothetical protein